MDNTNDQQKDTRPTQEEMKHNTEMEEGIAHSSDPAGDGTVPTGPQDLTGGGAGATGPAGAAGTVGSGGITGKNPDRAGTINTTSKVAGVENAIEGTGNDESSGAK